METLTPGLLELIEPIRREEPSSSNETARVVDRDVKYVHEELGRLAQLGIIYFEEEAQRKRPVMWFNELVIELLVRSRNWRDGAGSPLMEPTVPCHGGVVPAVARTLDKFWLLRFPP